MDDNKKDSGYRSSHSYPQMNDSGSWNRRDERNRDRDYDRYKSRRGDRDRRRSRSRSPPTRRRDRDRDRDDNRDRRHNNSSRRRYDEDRDRLSEDYSQQSESSSALDRSSKNDWRLKLTNIRDAHFNRSKQLHSVAQNQFTNDGSFLEKFKQMAGQNSNSSNVIPNSLALASSSIKFDSEITLPPLTTVQAPDSSKPCSSTGDKNEDLDGVPIKKPLPVPLPASIGRRRTAKPLKTGIVFKKSQQSEEDEASQEKLDAWSKYLQEVQQYKKDNCVEEDSSRPLVK